MKTLSSILSLCLLSYASYAQQDLRDVNYIYSLDEDNRRLQNVAYNIVRLPGVAYLYNDVLYKGTYPPVHIFDCKGKTYRKPSKIAKFTNDKDIKTLHVLTERKSNRKILYR